MQYCVICLFFVLFRIVPSKVQCVSDVPAIIWNIKGGALDVEPVSAFEVSNKKLTTLAKQVAEDEKSTSLLVFLTEELSLEEMAHESLSDSSSNSLGKLFDTRPHMLLPHVRNPLKLLHNEHCRKEEIHIDDKMGAKALQSVSSALDGSCIVVIRLKDSEAAAGKSKTQIDVMKEVLSSLSTSKKNVIGVFTAIKSSWESPENQYKSRNLLAETDEPKTGIFFNYSGCLIMYATNVTVKSISNEDPPKETTVIVPLDFDLDGSNCSDSEPTNELVIKFTKAPQYPTLIIRMMFGKKRNLWNLIDSDVTLKNQSETTEHTEVTKPSYLMEAPVGFSYSCGTLAFQTTNSTIKYVITIEGFQIQPFEVKEVFSSSFDCVPFFSLPIWMGLIVGILFIIILNTGVYALFAVKTMDRFDDPKGKTISVAFSAD